MYLILFLLIAQIKIIFGNDEFYSLKAFDSQNNEESMRKYQGMVILIVNVASECSYTEKHYKDLSKLYNILNRHRKFTVLAFPCNQFGGQEPKRNEEIEFIVRTRYKAEFPLYAKIEVMGSNAHPLFKYLAAKTNQVPEWNFWKYLVDHEGNVVGVWGPNTSVEDLFDVIKNLVDKAEAVPSKSSRKSETVKKQEL